MSAKQMLVGLKWSVLGRLFSQVISWTLTLIIIRILTPHDYGLLAMAQSVLVFAFTLNELGMGSSIVQRPTIERWEIGALNSFFLLLNLALVAVILAVSPVASTYFNEPALTGILPVLSSTFLIMALAVVPRSLLLRDMRFRAIAAVRVVAAIAAGFLTLYFALSDFGVWALVYGAIAAAAIETIGYMIAVGTPPRFGARFTALRPHLRFGFVILAQRLVWIAYIKADIFVLGRLFGSRTVGTYSVGLELATLPLDKVGQAVNQVVFAGFSRIQSDPQAVERYFLRGLRLASLGAFPVFFGISVVAAPLVALVLGPKWLDSAIVLQLMAPVVALRLISGLVSETLNALGKATAMLRNVVVTATCVIAGIAVGVQWGVPGLCVGWGAGFAVSLLVLLYRFGQSTGIAPAHTLGAMARPLLACVVMYACAYGIQAPLAHLGPLVVLPAAVATGAIAYALACLLVCRPYWDDVASALKTIRT